MYTCFVFHSTYTILCKKYCCIELPIVMKTKQKKSESLQTEGRHFRSMICKFSDV